MTHPALYFAAGLAAVIVLLSACHLLSRRRQRKLSRDELLRAWGAPPDREYGPLEMSRIENDAACIAGGGDPAVDAITWNDLDMDAVYKRINACKTDAGDAVLYAALRNPTDPRAVEERRQAIRWAGRETGRREAVLSELHRAGHRPRASLTLPFRQPLTASWRIWACCGLLAALAAGLILALAGVAPFHLPLLLALVNTGASVYLHAKNARYVDSIAHVLSLAGAASRAAAVVGGERGAVLARLASLGAVCKKVADGGFLTFFYENNTLALIFNHALLLEAVAYEWFARRVERNKAALWQMIVALGELDMCLAAASYRASSQQWCEPLWLGGAPALTARDIVHPLVGQPVPNSLDTRGHILLTGSNATGKSTFLRAVAVNAILAQSIATCAARAYSAGFFRIVTSMAVRDSVIAGESYFVAEIKALKRILDRAEGDLPGLIIIDEVLRGTNTVERIAASSEYLRELSARRCLCFAATHDIELTYLLDGEYRNMHFAETLTDGGMEFDYRLRPGRTTSMNAIALLELLAYPPGMVERARRSAAERADPLRPN